MDTLLNELNNPPERWIAVCLVSWMVGSVATLLWLRVANRARQAAQDPAPPFHQALTSLTISISQRQDRLEQELTKRDEIIAKILKGCAEHCLRLDNIEAYLAGQSDKPVVPKLHKPNRARSEQFPNLSEDQVETYKKDMREGLRPDLYREAKGQFPDGTRLEVK